MVFCSILFCSLADEQGITALTYTTWKRTLYCLRKKLCITYILYFILFRLFPECKDVRLDIAFVVDASEVQTSDDHYHLLEFLKSTIQSLDPEIANGNIRIALVVYTHDVNVEFQLTTYTVSAEMINYIENLTPRVGGTNTGLLCFRSHVIVYDGIR